MHIRGTGYRPKRRRLEPATIEELDTIVEHMPDKWKLMILLASWCALRYQRRAGLSAHREGREPVDRRGALPIDNRIRAVGEYSGEAAGVGHTSD